MYHVLRYQNIASEVQQVEAALASESQFRKFRNLRLGLLVLDIVYFHLLVSIVNRKVRSRPPTWKFNNNSNSKKAASFVASFI